MRGQHNLMSVESELPRTSELGSVEGGIRIEVWRSLTINRPQGKDSVPMVNYGGEVGRIKAPTEIHLPLPRTCVCKRNFAGVTKVMDPAMGRLSRIFSQSP